PSKRPDRLADFSFSPASRHIRRKLTDSYRFGNWQSLLAQTRIESMHPLVPFLCIVVAAIFCSASSAPTTLPFNPNLPDAMVFLDGTAVRTREDWQRRRSELLELFSRYEYGHLPPGPTNLQ